jgi:4-aminobutyrate aminotransferase/(S)-3-amino-2-methylpropionate transaminase
MPLAAVIGKAEIMDAPEAGGPGGTYAGNPVACAAALATFEIMDDAFFARAEIIGRRIRSAFEEIAQRFPKHVFDVRGLGAMIGIEFHASVEPIVPRIIEQARERGVLLMPAGAGNVIRALPPLVIDDDTLNEALRRISDAIDSVIQKEQQNS